MARRSAKYNYGSFSPGIRKTSSRSNSSLFRVPKSTTRRSSTNTRRHNASYSSYSSTSSLEDNSGCGVALGILFIVVFGALILWSFSWSWESSREAYYHGYIHKVDHSWLKWIFYPISIAGVLFGIFGLKISLPKDTSEGSTPMSSNSGQSAENVNQESAPIISPKNELIDSRNRLTPKELKDRQWALRSIFNEDELRREAGFLHNEIKKYQESEMIGGLTPLAFDGMTDYYLKKQLTAIQSSHGNNKDKTIGEILLLVTELDSYRGDTDTSYRLLIHVISKIKDLSRPILAVSPNTKLFDVTLQSFIESAESLANDRKSGKRFDDSFEALMHK